MNPNTLYDYPAVAFNFNYSVEMHFNTYHDLEDHIRTQLTSSSSKHVKDGLSNVLYWGHYRAGYRDTRVGRFRDKVDITQLDEFSKIIDKDSISPLGIKSIKLPQFSGFAFVSKIMMFLDPDNYVTLDKKIMELSDPDCKNSPLTCIPFGEKETSIRISKNSQHHYLRWCDLCKRAAERHFHYERAVDAERHFFAMVEKKDHANAKRIIRAIIENN